jgi:hypothetical protein
MNPTQILNLQGFEYIRKIENLIRLPLGRNRAGPSCTVRVAHAHNTGSARVHSVCGPRLAGPATAYAARDGAVRHGMHRVAALAVL